MIYKELIKDMTWSYSRIESFVDCPYRWFLKYIKKCKGIPLFYSSYGTFMHRLIEGYYNDEVAKDELSLEFLCGFSTNVRGERPRSSTVEKYIQEGKKYFENFAPFPYSKVEVEGRFDYKIGRLPFVAYIDFLGEKDGDLYIIDNKSRDLKPRVNKERKSNETLDKMLRQLYLYAAAVKKKYKQYPKSLCFNCFRTGVFIEEPFIKTEYDKTIAWAQQQIKKIENESDFLPIVDFFKCRHLCEVKEDCIYWR